MRDYVPRIIYSSWTEYKYVIACKFYLTDQHVDLSGYQYQPTSHINVMAISIKCFQLGPSVLAHRTVVVFTLNNAVQCIRQRYVGFLQRNIFHFG